MSGLNHKPQRLWITYGRTDDMAASRVMSLQKLSGDCLSFADEHQTSSGEEAYEYEFKMHVSRHDRDMCHILGQEITNLTNSDKIKELSVKIGRLLDGYDYNDVAAAFLLIHTFMNTRVKKRDRMGHFLAYVDTFVNMMAENERKENEQGGMDA